VNIVFQVVCQHVEEAAILWLRRDWAMTEPHYTLDDLAKLDGQLDAHLDGLRVAEAAAPAAAWELCREELRWQEPGEVFAAAVLALESAESERLGNVLDLAAASCELSRPLVSALAWLPKELAWQYVPRFLGEHEPGLRRVGIAASAVAGCDPGAVLAESVDDQDELLSARSLRAIGELGRTDLLPALRVHLDDDAERCRCAAAWSAALLSPDDAAVRVLRRVAAEGKERSLAALQLAICRTVAAEARAWLLEFADQDASGVRTAVVGTGILGIVDLVPRLLERMETPALARVAGEAFSMITGVDLAEQDLEGDWPEGFEAGPNDDPADENVEVDPDENLPWPDVAKVKDWWMRHRDEFEPGVRYLCGRPMTEDWLEHVLRYGYQRQRAAAALELAIRRPGTPLFNVKAPGYRQQQLLGLR